MSDYFGDIRLGDTIDIKFTTRQISGAPSTLSGSPVISAYPSNSTTELTAGITLSVDFDSRTGYNNVRVVASNGNGYATATNYDLCITTGTVNSVSVVGESIGSFSIENRSALMPATAGRTAVVDASGLIDANAVKLGPTGSGTAQTARDIGASVLVGDKTGFSLSAGGISAIWQDTTAGDFTAANSIGKSIMNGVSLGTGLTIVSVSGAVGSVSAGVTVTTNNDKTGYTASTVSDKTGYSLSAGGVSAIYTTQLTEAYAAQGVVPTLAQILFESRALQAEKSVAATTLTTKKIDGSATAATYTLSDATSPTAITRAT